MELWIGSRLDGSLGIFTIGRDHLSLANFFVHVYCYAVLMLFSRERREARLSLRSYSHATGGGNKYSVLLVFFSAVLPRKFAFQTRRPIAKICFSRERERERERGISREYRSESDWEEE